MKSLTEKKIMEEKINSGNIMDPFNPRFIWDLFIHGCDGTCNFCLQA